MNILGIDFGTKRVGLALGDTESASCVPWKVLEKPTTAALLQELVLIVKEEGIRTLVIGEPLALDGTRGKAAKNVDAFVSELQSLLPHIPTHLVDERFSSKLADQFTEQYGIGRDALAAAAILQSYLDKV